MSRIMRLMAVLIGLLGIVPEVAIASGTSNQSLPVIKRLVPWCGKYHGIELLSRTRPNGRPDDAQLCVKLEDNVCTVRNHTGGCDTDFNEIYHYILEHNTQVRFEGSIQSFTAVLAMALTLRPGSACIGEDVVFALHQKWMAGLHSKVYGDEFGTYIPNLYPPLIKQWVWNQPGGEPASTKRFLLMPYEVAKGFFQKCDNMKVVLN